MCSERTAYNLHYVTWSIAPDCGPRALPITLTRAATITKNGWERTVQFSGEAYERLKLRDRRAIAAGELTDRQVAALKEAKVPEQHAELDWQLAHWKP
jgi:hypothetical protein